MDIPTETVVKALCLNVHQDKCPCFDYGGCRLPDVAPLAKCIDLVRVPEDSWKKAQEEYDEIQRRIDG